MVYLFPLWFLKKAFIISLTTGFSNEIQVSLRVTRIVSAGAEVFLMAHQNNVNGLRRVFRERIASPNDMLTDGESVLHVSPFISYEINPL